MIRVQIDYANACCGKEQPNNLANLPKYAVQGRGATKPLAPESPPVLLLLHVPHLRA